MEKYSHFLIAFCLWFFAIVGVHSWISTPVVQISHSTGKCVNVLPKGDCNKLPSRYEVEIVK